MQTCALAVCGFGISSGGSNPDTFGCSGTVGVAAKSFLKACRCACRPEVRHCVSMAAAAASTLTITKPDDFHLHVRDGPALQAVVPLTAQVFKRAVIMPNLRPPVVNAKQVHAVCSLCIKLACAALDYQISVQQGCNQPRTVCDWRSTVMHVARDIG